MWIACNGNTTAKKNIDMIVEEVHNVQGKSRNSGNISIARRISVISEFGSRRILLVAQRWWLPWVQHNCPEPHAYDCDRATWRCCHPVAPAMCAQSHTMCNWPLVLYGRDHPCATLQRSSSQSARPLASTLGPRGDAQTVSYWMTCAGCSLDQQPKAILLSLSSSTFTWILELLYIISSHFAVYDLGLTITCAIIVRRALAVLFIEDTVRMQTCREAIMVLESDLDGIPHFAAKGRSHQSQGNILSLKSQDSSTLRFK